MPTTTITVPGEPSIGPASHVLLSTDLIGPIPNDWIWSLEVYVPGEEVFVWWQRGSSFGGHSKLFTIGVEQFSSQVQDDAQLFVADGTAVTVRGLLLNSASVAESEGDRTDLFWTLQGNALREVIKERDVQGGLTVPQQTQLQLAAANTAIGFPTSIGGVIQTAVNTLIAHPPIGVLSLGADPVTLTGRGSLTRPGLGLNVAAFGAFLSFFTVPIGFGTRDGAVPEFQQRIVQLATVHMLIDDSQEVVTEVLDLHVDGYLWLWSTALPQRILYDVSPGCVVILRWIEV